MKGKDGFGVSVALLQALDSVSWLPGVLCEAGLCEASMNTTTARMYKGVMSRGESKDHVRNLVSDNSSTNSTWAMTRVAVRHSRSERDLPRLHRLHALHHYTKTMTQRYSLRHYNSAQRLTSPSSTKRGSHSARELQKMYRLIHHGRTVLNCHPT